jgi:succinate dehydrogenase / fumarate reductase, cytochrome b subunit
MTLSKAEERHFWLRRLHSLTGIVPVGGFIAFHLFENFTSTRGAHAYNEAAEHLQQLPLSMFLEIFVIGVPVFFHGIYGLFITTEAKPTALPYYRNWMYTVQRVTGIVLFFFIVFHLWTTRFVELWDKEAHSNLFELVSSRVSSPVVYWFYVLGIVAATWHLANGIWSFCIRWGITVGPRSQKLVVGISAAVFFVLTWLGLSSIRAFLHHG